MASLRPLCLEWNHPTSPLLASPSLPIRTRFATACLSSDSSPRSSQPVSLVAGASRGLGLEFTRQLLLKHPESSVVATCRNPESAHNLVALKEQNPSRLTVLPLDVTKEATVEEVAKEIAITFGRLDLLITTIGVLHMPNVMHPENIIEDVERANVLRAFKINAVGPLIVAKHMMPLLKMGMGEGTGRGGAVLANLSCKVGSISDNRQGGWYAYRVSKACLNQYTKTLAVECLRKKEPVICVALHPGPVDTELSKPYSCKVPPENLYTAEASVEKLVEIIDSLKMEDAAKFWAYNRQEVPW